MKVDEYLIWVQIKKFFILVTICIKKRSVSEGTTFCLLCNCMLNTPQTHFETYKKIYINGSILSVIESKKLEINNMVLLSLFYSKSGWKKFLRQCGKWKKVNNFELIRILFLFLFVQFKDFLTIIGGYFIPI